MILGNHITMIVCSFWGSVLLYILRYWHVNLRIFSMESSVVSDPFIISLIPYNKISAG